MEYPQVDSYNYFVKYQLKKKIEQFHLEIDDLIITFKNTGIKKCPTKIVNKQEVIKKMNEVLNIPKESWDVPITVDVYVSNNGEIISVIKEIELFRFPVLTGSILDTNENDPGLFIINGTEFAPIIQERLVYNKLIKINNNRIEISCKKPNTKNVIAVRLTMEEKQIFWLDENIIKKKSQIPIYYILHVLSNTVSSTDRMFLQSYIKTNRYESIEYIYNNVVIFKDDSLNHNDKEKQVIELLNNRFFVHIDGLSNKYTFLLLMINELLYGVVDDRDNLIFKGYSTLSNYFEEILNQYLLELFKNNLKKRLLQKQETKQEMIVKIPKYMNECAITGVLKSLIATGNGLGGSTGLTNAVQRISYTSYFSVTRKLAVKQKEGVKMTSMRLISPSQYGYICSAESPDGKSIGLVKHLTVLAQISRYTTFDINYLIDGLVEEKGILLLVNGIPIMYTKEIEKIINRLSQKKREGKINRSVTYILHKNYLEILNSEGRLIRPLYNGYNVEYVDAGTILDNYTELDECAQYGYLASLIPFANHNQAARNTYYSAQMHKQAIGANHYMDNNHFYKNYSTYYALQTVHKPLVSTKIQKQLMDGKENGQMVIVCTKTHEFNQEDSVILNQSSIDRGLFRSDSFKTYTSELNTSLFIHDWNKTPKIPKGEYHIPVGVRVLPGDVLLLPNIRLPLSSPPGIVHQVQINGTKNIWNIILLMRHQHIPQVGDKVTSEHAQKGTISAILSSIDMPYCLSGIVADMIVSPHAFPSRQTFGHQMGALASKVVSIFGDTIDATPFNNVNPVLLNKKLTPQFSTERMIDGETGLMLSHACYVEPIYYHLLKHHAETKGSVRTEGPIDVITRQPVSGRVNNGGFKKGSMENNCIIAHGASGFLHERSTISCDKTNILYCENCGRIVNNPKQPCFCRKTKFNSTPGRYATKLLFQELQSFNLDILFHGK